MLYKIIGGATLQKRQWKWCCSDVLWKCPAHSAGTKRPLLSLHTRGRV